MSLNRTLSRLFDEVRRETRRNKEFADRIDAILRAHVSQREVADEAAAAAADEEARAPLGADAPDSTPPPAINPVGLYQREGAEVLRATLGDPAIDAGALRALIAEHNLDPGGEAAALDKDGLVAHIVAFAERRAERDRKLFDY